MRGRFGSFRWAGGGRRHMAYGCPGSYIGCPGSYRHAGHKSSYIRRSHLSWRHGAGRHFPPLVAAWLPQCRPNAKALGSGSRGSGRGSQSLSWINSFGCPPGGATPRFCWGGGQASCCSAATGLFCDYTICLLLLHRRSVGFKYTIGAIAGRWALQEAVSVGRGG
jgi:hypothetical protein